MSLGMMTKLEAVNRLLAATGETPVQTLEQAYIQKELAESTLDRVSRDIQSEGWWFNEDEDVVATKDVNDQVVLPSDTLKVFCRQDNGNLVQRGLSIYDRENRTFVITDEVKIDLIIQLDWDTLPHSAREHITAVAAFEFYKDFYGAESRNDALERSIVTSRTNLQKDNMEARDTNMFSGSHMNNIAFSNRRG